MSARLPLPLVGLATALALLLAALGPAVSPAAATGCPNQARRAEQGAAALALPDCRAYELVSPPAVEPFFENAGNPGNLIGANAKPRGQAWGVQGAVGGEALSYFSPYLSAESPSNGAYYLSRRGEGGWSTGNITPPQSVTNSGVGCYNAYFDLFTPDLSQGILADGYGQGSEVRQIEHNVECGTDEPSLVPAEPQGVQNIFLEDDATGAHQLLNVTPSSVVPHHAWPQGASSDLREVFFSEEALLTPEAPPLGPPPAEQEPSEDFYVSSVGSLRLLTFLPDGTPVPGELANANKPFLTGTVAGPGPSTYTHAVSGDGAHAAFVAEGKLYSRENPADPESAAKDGEGNCIPEAAKACTVQLDAAQPPAPGPGGGGRFEWASVDGSKVFFRDESQLTAGATAEPGKPDLYEYDFGRAPGQRLSDLTANLGEAANVLGVSGVSEDGSFVYFVAAGDLTGPQENSRRAVAAPGLDNLYLRHAGTTTFIATLDPEDNSDWELPKWLSARTSAGGGFLAFNSIAKLTGYENLGPCVGPALEQGPCQEIFLYDAATEQLECASCDPDGAAPTGPASLPPPIRTPLNDQTLGHLQRSVSDSGQVFFQSANAAIPADTDSLSDVYEFVGGELHLLSSGAGEAPAFFTEASASGSDVFFASAQHLLPGPFGNGFVIYDAREEGGFPLPVATPVCDGVDCKGQFPAPPVPPSPGSSSFFGPPNPHPPKCKKGKVRKGDKCVKKKSKKKQKSQSKKKQNGHKKKQAGHKQKGGSK